MAASTFLDALSKSDNQLDEFLSGSDREDEQDVVDDFHHTKMLDAIRSLGGKRKVTQRTEPSRTVSEYNLSQAEKEKVPPWQLLLNLKDSTEAHRQTKNQMRSMSRNADVLPLPLSKPQQQRIERQVAYEKVDKEVSMWEPVVKKNRLAEQMVFPLRQPDLRMQPTEKFVQRFKPKTALELEVEKLLKGSDHVLHDNAELTPAEEKALLAMSIEEAQERHNELKKMRALLSYQEMKARRQNKIKSKSYHRILKKERLKNQMKEFEELKEKNPELALEKLQELEKQRVLERVSLRHKATGKWAKQQMLRSKYNQESREALLKQLELSRQLTRKVNVESSEEDDDDKHEPAAAPSEPSGLETRFFTSSNPWLRNPHVSIDVGGNEKDSALDVPARRDEDLKEGSAHNVSDADSGKTTGKAIETVTGSNEKVNVFCGADTVPVSSSNEMQEGHLEAKSNTEAETIENGNTERPAKQQLKEIEGKDVIGEVFIQSNMTSKVSASGKSSENSKRKLTKKQRGRGGEKEVLLEGSLNAGSSKNGRRKSTAKKAKQKAPCLGEVDIDDLFESFEQDSQKNEAYNKSHEAQESDDEYKLNTVEETNAVPEMNDEPMLAESLTRRQTLEDLENNAMEEADSVEQESVSHTQPLPKGEDRGENEHKKVEVDPTKFMDVAPTALKSKGLDLQGPGDEVLDDDNEEEDEDQAVTIREAFADDDVVNAFREEKEAQVKEDTPAGVDNFLPGWGSWTGADIQPDKRKQRRFFQKPPPRPPRKDRHLGHVIINEKKDDKVAAHQVSQLPNGFTNVSQFEAVISHPIGSTWNTETAFRDLTQPRVITKQGAIIEPIEATNALLKKKRNAIRGLRHAERRGTLKKVGEKKKK